MASPFAAARGGHSGGYGGGHGGGSSNWDNDSYARHDRYYGSGYGWGDEDHEGPAYGSVRVPGQKPSKPYVYKNPAIDTPFDKPPQPFHIDP